MHLKLKRISSSGVSVLKRTFIFGISFFVFLGFQSLFAQTLNKTLELAYQNSNLLQSSTIQQQLQQEVMIRSNADKLPTVNLSAGTDLSNRNARGNPYHSTHTGQIQLQGQVNLYDFGSTDLATKIEELRLQSLHLKNQGIIQTVLYNATDAYYQILRQQNLLELEKKSLRALEERLNASQERFELGALTKTQLSLVEAQVAGARGGVQSREGQLEIARELFFLAVGEYPQRLINPNSTPAIPTSVGEAIELANSMNPSLQQAKIAVTIAEINRTKSYIDALTPPIRLQGSLTSNFDLRDQEVTRKNTYSIGLQYSIPIFTGGKLSSAKRTVDSQVQVARVDLMQQSLMIENQINNSWHQLQIAESLIAVISEERDYSRLALEGIITEEALGAKTPLDVIEAEKDLLASNTNVIDALINRDLAKYNLLRAVGMLTPEYLGLSISQ